MNQNDESPAVPEVGDVTIIPYPAVRERVGCPAEAGLLMEDRRHVARVHFPGIDRTFWLDRGHLEAVALERLPVHPLVERLHRIARRIDAVLIEVQHDDGSVVDVHVFTPALTFEDLEYMRALLGEELLEMGIEAGSVRRVKIRLRFRYVAEEA